MKKTILLLLLSLTAGSTFAQKVFQEIITDYTNLRRKPKIVEVTLPKGVGTVFYRVTTFHPDKVNTSESLYAALRVITPDKLTTQGYDFTQHLLTPTAELPVAVRFFEKKTAAQAFADGRETTPCSKIDSTRSAAGIATCKAEKMYVVMKPLGNVKMGTVKLEVSAWADRPEDPVNDRYPYSIQNELSGEIAYEVSGDRTYWQAFYLPSQRKAEFKLAAPQVYVRVSTLDNKTSEEYKIDADKKYRFFWDKDKNRMDLKEIKP